MAGPIFLLADSSLLFARSERADVTARIRQALREPSEARAAYVGAASDDNPETFGIFEAAMDLVGIAQRKHVTALFSPEEHAFLEAADLIVLGGGDPKLGWERMKASGLSGAITDRYLRGATLVGVSAGAILLGERGFSEEGITLDLFESFGFVPFALDAHDEERDWRRLRDIVESDDTLERGIGIPFGGAAYVSPALELEPMGNPLIELERTDDGLRETMLVGGGGHAAIGTEIDEGGSAKGA